MHVLNSYIILVIEVISDGIMRSLYILFLVTGILVLPNSAISKVREIRVVWEYPYPANIAGFRLYHEGSPVCETTDGSATSMNCTINVPDGAAQFTMTSFLQDGTESETSAPLSYIFSSTLKAVMTADVLAGESPLAVTFDAAQSTGNIVLYEWMFGDGETGFGNTTTHTFFSPGNYTVTLKTTDTLGATDQDSLSIAVTEPVVTNNPPVAVISSSATVGKAPMAVQFDGSGSTDSDGTIVSHTWEMGDGGTASGETAHYTYNTAGSFIARLTVTDNGGLSDSVTTPVLVSEPVDDTNLQPVAVISLSTDKGHAPLKVLLNATKSHDPDGEVTGYFWNFGDGTTGSGEHVVHTFSQPATYTITLKVTDNKGAVSQSTKVLVTVLSPGHPLDLLPERFSKPLIYILNLLLGNSGDNAKP